MDSARQLIAQPRVLVIAHRGDSLEAPENTLPAFASAVKIGADLVELDYRHSADGVPVVFHDALLDRATDAVARWAQEKIPLTTKTLAELCVLDAGSWFDPRFGGARIATLAEALDTITAGSMTLIEHKAGDAATCVELLKSKQMLDRTVVQSFDWDYLAECHRLAPNLALVALGEKQLDERQLDEMASTGAIAVGWENESTDRDTIAAIHRRGWKAWVWTADHPGRMRELITLGIDGIITNRPRHLQQVLAELANSQNG